MENSNKRFDFYFSYANKDAEMISQIIQYVTESGYSCYKYDDSLSGMSFFDSTYSAIRNANVLVLFITEEFINSQYCFKEAYMAIDTATNYDKLI